MVAKETALALIELVKADKAFQIEVADELIDALIGNDPTAIVKEIKGIPADLVEVVSDGLADALKAALKQKLGVV